jgi:hypothetical protein
MRTAILTILVVLAISCTDSGTEPQPLSHEFVWQIDSIDPATFELYGETLWGTSENKVYMGAYHWSNRKALFKYDGTSWTSRSLRDLAIHVITDIDGFDSSHFAVVGDGGRWGTVGIYADGRWDTISIPRLRPWITCVDYVSETEIYFGSVDGILKYDGDKTVFLIDSTDSELNEQGFFSFFPTSIRKGADGQLYYISMYAENLRTVLSLFAYSDGYSVLIDSIDIQNPVTQGRIGRNLNVIDGAIVTGTDVLNEVRNASLSPLLPHAGGMVTGSLLNGNLFTVYSGKTIYHYNGVSWADITPTEISNARRVAVVYDILYVDSTLFVVCQLDDNKTYVLRARNVPTPH